LRLEIAALAFTYSTIEPGMICLMVQSVVFFCLSVCFVHTENILAHFGPLSLGQGRKLLWLVKRVVSTFYDSPTKNP
jgi:hypothetical protein